MRIIWDDMSIIDDYEKFVNDELHCFQYLAMLKWANGFACKKCGYTKYIEGKQPYSRRCMKCKSEESATAHTLFHNVKFPINKAFFLTINYLKNNKDFSVVKLANQLEIKEITCWKFKNKIEERILQLQRQNPNDQLKFTDILTVNIVSPFI